MRPDVSPTPIRLADYAPPAWVAEHVDLTFDLAPRGARVRARIRFVIDFRNMLQRAARAAGGSGCATRTRVSEAEVA